MTTSLPPTQSFAGIYFNPNFWTSGSSSLTQDIANGLYLEKTTPDTATALQTFSAGVSTQNMTSPNLAADVNLFPNQTAGTLKLASSARSVHCSNIDCQGSGINNASTPANGSLSIGSSQTGTAGTISIGTNAARTGDITIGANGCSINLGGHLVPTYTTQPNLNTEIGFTQQFTITNTTVGTSFALLGAAPTIPIGRWLIQGYCQLPIATAVGVHLTFNNTAGVNVFACNSATTNAVNASYLMVEYVASFTSQQTTWGLYAQASVISTALTNIRLVITRIA